MKFSKLVYIAGPYTAPSRPEILANIARAASAASVLRENGIACIVPHLESIFNEDAMDESGWLEHGLALLEWCDGVLLLDGWKDSKGSVEECEFAKDSRIPLFQRISDAIAWGKDI